MKVIAIFSAILAVVASNPRWDNIPTKDLYRGNGYYANPGHYADQMNYVHPSNNYMIGPAARTGQTYPAGPFNYDSRDEHEGPVDPSGFTDHTGLSEYPGHYSGPNHAGSVDHVNHGYHDGLEHHGGPAGYTGPPGYDHPYHGDPPGYADPPDYDHSHHGGPADYAGPAVFAGPADYAGPAGYTGAPGYDHPHHGDPPGYADPPDYDHPPREDIHTYIDHGWIADYPGPAGHAGPPAHGGPPGYEGPPGYDYPPGYDDPDTWNMGYGGPSDSQHRTGAYVGPKVKTWTAMELFDAINANSDDELMPYIKEAANEILLALFTNYNWKNVLAAIPSPSGQNTWKLQELEQYSEIPATGEEFRAALDHAHHLFIDLQQANPHVHIRSMPVVIGAVDISTWNMEELIQALQDPSTKPELKERVQKALHELQLRATSDRDKISIVTRVGLIDNNPEYYELSIPPELLPLLKNKAMYAFDEPDYQELHPEPMKQHNMISDTVRYHLMKGK